MVRIGALSSGQRKAQSELCYERAPGAASAPLQPKTYRPRAPQQSVLYQLVQEHLETFLEQARRDSANGYGLPAHVERAFYRFLECGQIQAGFVRLKCERCEFERFVTFSCKRRGLCPSCDGRTMADSAAHLVDRVIPLVPMRQWVLTCPIPIRLAMARDPRLVSQVLRVFHQRIFAFHRRIARSMGIEGGQCGSVTFVQRAGGGVNSHVHFHGLVPDGVFYETNEGGVSFVPTLGPTDADVAGIVASIVRRVLRLMQGADENENEPDNEDGRGAWQSAFAPPSGLPKVESGWEHPKLGSLCANTDGFSLHAGRLVPATDRAGLEQLCRYGLRSSFCASRLSVSDDGQLYVYRLKRPWPDGRLEMQFEPLDLMRRLAHLVPPPRFNQVRYTGVFSPNSAFRSRIVPRIDIEKAEAHHFRRIDTSESARLCSMLPNALSLASNAEVKSDASQAAQSNAALPEPLPIPPALLGTPQPEKDLLPLRDRYLKWDQLLRRTFSIDVTRCPRCDGRMKVLAAISFPPHVQKILSHLGLPSELPPIASARAPPQSDFDLDFDCDN